MSAYNKRFIKSVWAGGFSPAAYVFFVTSLFGIGFGMIFMSSAFSLAFFGFSGCSFLALIIEIATANHYPFVSDYLAWKLFRNAKTMEVRQHGILDVLTYFRKE